MVASKEQERKALEKIKKIVSELGEDSYIATAFEGCFEIAESNIENDFADSMKFKYQSECERTAELERKMANLGELRLLQKNLEYTFQTKAKQKKG